MFFHKQQQSQPATAQPAPLPVLAPIKSCIRYGFRFHGCEGCSEACTMRTSAYLVDDPCVHCYKKGTVDCSEACPMA